ncbi:MAG: DUF2341 domain-containing protein [Candidatus Micrarchaeia archaeon]|jgi:hypothetical protein
MAFYNRRFFPAFLALIFSAALLAPLAAAWWDSNYQYRRQITITDGRPAVPPTEPAWWNSSYAFRQRLNVQSTTTAPSWPWAVPNGRQYAYRQRLNITNPSASAIAAGYAVNISLNTTQMVLGGKANANFSDVNYIIYDTAGTDYLLHRVNEEQDDLLVSWHLDETSGTTAADESEYGNAATVSGAAFAAGKIGNGLSFDGINDYSIAGGFSSLGTSNAPHSFEGWFKANSLTGDIIHMSSQSDGRGWCLPPVALDAGKVRAMGWNGGGVYATSTTTVSTGQWYHFASTWDSTNGLRIYVNGALEATTPMANYAASGASNYVWLGLGTTGTCAGDKGHFNGAIDEVKAYSRALDPSEIRAHYLAGFRGQSIYKGMALNDTKIWFKTQNPISAGGYDDNYWIYYGGPAVNPPNDPKNVFEFYDGFDGASLDTGVWAATGTASASGGALSVSTGSVYKKTAVSNSQDRLFEAKLRWTSPDAAGGYAGLNIADAQSTQNGNAGSNGIAYALTNVGSANVVAFGASGSAANYNVADAVAQFTETQDTDYKLGILRGASSLVFYKNGVATGTYSSVTWTKPPAYVWFGRFEGAGAGTADGKDLRVDWVRVRPYSPTEPKTSLSGSEQAYADYESLSDYSVSTSINTTKLILENKANANFSDLRLAYYTDYYGSGWWTELDRVNDDQDELIGAWHFDEGSGTSTDDESGNDNVLAIAGGTAWTTGSTGNALQFDGSNGKYATLATPSGNLPTGGGPLTITAWIKPTGAMSGGNYDGIVSWGSRGTCNTAILLSITDAGKPSMANWCNDFISSTLPAAAWNQWNFIALTMSGQSVTLYINGQSQSGTLGAAPNIQYGQLGIGCTDCPGRNFNGAIDEVKIYNRALSATELQAQYQAGVRGQPVYKGMGLDGTKVWFKAASVPAGGADSNYWLYYGAPNPQPQMADPGNVYLFYDGFSGATLDPAKWAVSAGSGGADIAAVNTYWKSLQLSPDNVAPTKTAQTLNGFDGNIAVEFTANPYSIGNPANIGLGLMDSNQADGNGFWPMFATGNIFSFWQHVAATPPVWSGLQSGGSNIPQSYSRYRLLKSGANYSFYKDGTQIGSTWIMPQIRAPVYLVGPRVWNEGASDIGNIMYDNVRVRKYNTKEPTVSTSGAEQYQFDYAGLPAGYSVPITFDHAALAGGAPSKSLADGADVRVVREYPPGNFVELDRVNENAFNTPSTEIWLKLRAAISPAASDANYWLYYGNPTAANPPQNGSNVYAFYDNFSGSSLDPKWTIYPGSAAMSVAGGLLSLSKTGATGLGAWAKFNANGWPYFVEKKSRITQATGNGLRDRFYLANQQAYLGSESGIQYYYPRYYFDYGIFQNGVSAISLYWNGYQSQTEALNTWYVGKYYANATDVRWEEPTAPAAAYSRKENGLSLDLISLALTSYPEASTSYAVDYDYVKVRNYVASEPSAALSAEAAQCTGDLTPCAGGTGICCGGACQTVLPSCTDCKKMPYTCTGGALACSFQPTTYADTCGTVSCPIGQTGSDCTNYCDGAGNCGACTPVCTIANASTCNLQLTFFSPSAWTSYAPNETIAVNYSVLNSTSGRPPVAASSTITLANGTPITPAYDAANNVYHAKVSPVSMSGTPSETITVSANASGCGDADKTIAYAVIGSPKPAVTAPDFELVLLPVLALLALLAVRRKKAGAA